MATTVAPRRRYLHGLPVFVGVLMLATLLWRADLGDVIAACRRAGWGFALITSAPALGYLLHSFAWWLALPSRIRPGFGRVFASYLAAQTVDDWVLGVAGEPLKVLALAPSNQRGGWSSLVLDNAAQLLANATFLATIVFMLASPRVGHGAWSGLLGGVLVAMSVLSLVWAIRPLGDTSTPGEDAPPCGRSSGFWRMRVRPLARRLAKEVSAGAALARQEPSRFLGCFSVHLLGKAWMVGDIAIALYVLEFADASAAMALAAGASAGSLIGAPIPGQIGALEAAYGASGAWMGVPIAVATAVALLRRARSLVWSAVGLMMVRRIVDPRRRWPAKQDRPQATAGAVDRSCYTPGSVA